MIHIHNIQHKYLINTLTDQADLATALADDTMMIEADVSAGEDGEPIMAHPPDTQSDLSLVLFLETVLQVRDSLYQFMNGKYSQ